MNKLRLFFVSTIFLTAANTAQAAHHRHHLGPNDFPDCHNIGPPPPLTCDPKTKWCTSIACKITTSVGGSADWHISFPIQKGWKRAGFAEGVVQWDANGGKAEIKIDSTPDTTDSLQCWWHAQGDPGSPFPPKPPKTGGVGGFCHTVGTPVKQ